MTILARLSRSRTWKWTRAVSLAVLVVGGMMMHSSPVKARNSSGEKDHYFLDKDMTKRVGWRSYGCGAQTGWGTTSNYAMVRQWDCGNLPSMSESCYKWDTINWTNQPGWVPMACPLNYDWSDFCWDPNTRTWVHCGATP